jgi:hypothetical protein
MKEFWQVIHSGHLGVLGLVQPIVGLDKADDGEFA